MNRPLRFRMSYRCSIAVSFVGVAASTGFGADAPGTVISQVEISSISGGLAPLVDGDEFGFAVASIGDVNGDGIGDVVVGAPLDDTGGTDRGAIYILLLKADGTVLNQRKIASGTSGFGIGLDNFDAFGSAVVSLGDVDGNGIVDLLVGAPGDDDGAVNAGSVWVVKLKPDATVLSYTKISATQGGLPSGLTSSDAFGGSVTVLGDLDGDSALDLAVGAPGSDAAGFGSGEVWILFMNPGAATVKSTTRLHGATPNLGFAPGTTSFGTAVCGIGDVDQDGILDLAVGAPLDDTGGPSNRGAIYLLHLAVDGKVTSHSKVAQGLGGFAGTIDTQSRFGSSITKTGDLDEDGIDDLIVGAPWSSGVVGGFWVLFLDAAGGVGGEQLVSPTSGDLGGSFVLGDHFGGAVASLGDINGDGIDDLLVGADGLDAGGVDRGAAFVLQLAGKWVDVGGGKLGTAGIPTLSGTGDLTAFSPVAITLTQARPSSPLIFLIGLSNLDAPLYGALVVPSPDILLTGLATDPTGSLMLAGPWPPGIPSDLTIYYQAWITDPLATFGYAASNGLSGTTP